MPQAKLSNPKQSARARTQGWYRYYAGYSSEFVGDALSIANADSPHLHVLDPWVGAGTTAAVAAGRGLSVTGVDINPALVVVAKARLLRSDISESLDALTEEIIDGARRHKAAIEPAEPLLAWYGPDASVSLRSVERSIFRLLVSPATESSAASVGPHHISSLAAFFYVALFLVTRSRLRSATTSNPTWIKGTVPPRRRAKPQQGTIHSAFRLAQTSLAAFLGIGSLVEVASEGRIEIQHGSSTSLNIPDDSVDVIITSPPYCTRIDYVAGVRPELAILGYDDHAVKVLRYMTLGNPTVSRDRVPLDSLSSRTAAAFLYAVKAHPSKASGGYYFRFFDTYFRMLDTSLREMGRVAKPGALAFIVLQDSFYKEVRLDLARVAAELAEQQGWNMTRQVDFPIPRTMAAINPRVREHRETFRATESVLVLGRG